MGGFEIAAGLLSLAALFSYLNHRFLGLPAAIGLMAIGLAMSLEIIAVALALLLKESLGAQPPASCDLVLLMSYNVVVFSILVQGLSMVPLLRRLGLSGVQA